MLGGSGGAHSLDPWIRNQIFSYPKMCSFHYTVLPPVLKQNNSGKAKPLVTRKAKFILKFSVMLYTLILFKNLKYIYIYMQIDSKITNFDWLSFRKYPELAKLDHYHRTIAHLLQPSSNSIGKLPHHPAHQESLTKPNRLNTLRKGIFLQILRLSLPHKSMTQLFCAMITYSETFLHSKYHRQDRSLDIHKLTSGNRGKYLESC